MATIFPRGSSELPSAEQVQGAVQALQSGGLPSKGCAFNDIVSSCLFPSTVCHHAQPSSTPCFLLCTWTSQTFLQSTVLRRCCAAATPIFAARCGCNPDFVAVRDAIQETYPTLTPAFLQGVNYIFALACGLQDTSCA